MPTTSINLPLYRVLRTLNVPEPDAEAAATAAPPDLSQLATKEELRAEIAGVRADLKVEISAVRAEVAGLRRTELVRAFRHQTGLTPHAWLTDRRVRAAQALLRRGDPPGQVAAATGFFDQAHFTRAFKARLGVTPGRYLRAESGRP